MSAFDAGPALGAVSGGHLDGRQPSNSTCMRSKSRASRLQRTSRTTRSSSMGEVILRFGDEVGFEVVLILIMRSWRV